MYHGLGVTTNHETSGILPTQACHTMIKYLPCIIYTVCYLYIFTYREQVCEHYKITKLEMKIKLSVV